ncbi:MAG: hypothetical protein DRQ47_11205 [Gammaproteobacteria bacterium]|nr:MAG: hypothetical protein DRQ47_11205 [Gammaproteobacteria bacterium]
MEINSLLAFIGLVAIGSYIQTILGFAIALIIAGGVTTLGLAPIDFTANVISFIALANTITAVHKKHHEIDLKILFYASIGVLCLTWVGLLLLGHLSSHFVKLLEILLGVAILVSGALLLIRPRPLKRVSPNYVHLAAGSFGGLLSGLFGVGGPPLVVHLYRQPLAFPVIRTTLLGVLGIMPIIRIGFETYNGNINESVLKLSLFCIPASILTTLFARRFPPRVPNMIMRRFAFSLLCVMGLFLIISNI